MAGSQSERERIVPAADRRILMVLVVYLTLLLGPPASLASAADRHATAQQDSKAEVCTVLADKRLEKPLRKIVDDYSRRSGSRITLNFRSLSEIETLVRKKQLACEAVVWMARDAKGKSPVGSLPGLKAVAWKHPSGEPVCVAALTERPATVALCRFLGGPTGHRFWAESELGLRVASGKTHTEAYEWIVKHRVGHTYPLTAVRMLRECGGIREGICIDIGCGLGNLDVELAKRTDFTIIGLDINPDAKPIFEKRMREAGLDKRVSFVVGDAQKLPFDDDYADVIVSRGTLTFIPDIAKCLREVDRVLKPTGVAFLGGRYVYTPQPLKISTEKLSKIVQESGVPGARVIDARGQWVKIIGPKAPKAAQKLQGGPHMLAMRFIADYAITKGKALLICGSDGAMAQGLQKGFLEMTDLDVTALYPSDKVAQAAGDRIRKAKQSDRITCKVGDVHALPFEEASFDLVAGVGPLLLWGEREKGMREIYHVLRPGGAALVGGKFLHMPDWRKTPSEILRKSAAKTGIPSIRVYDDMGQWVEIRKGIKDRGFRD